MTLTKPPGHPPIKELPTTSAARTARQKFQANPLQFVKQQEATAVDPVCGMTVDPSHSAGSHVHEGTTHHFCSRNCLAKFKADPQRFLDKAHTSKAKPEPHAAQGKYTCPMHPEVVQDGPGTCPKCGMALEPMQPSAEEGPDPELVSMQRRFWIGAVLTVPIFVIAMAGLASIRRADGISARTHGRTELGATRARDTGRAVVRLAVLRASLAVGRHRSPNMFTLIALGVGAAYLYSLAATIAPGMLSGGLSQLSWRD